MEIACPACGKANPLETAAVCSRCACDLTPLARILAGALWHLKAAARALRAGQGEAALGHAERSWSLRHSRHAARLAYLAATASGAGEEALVWRRRGNEGR